MKKLLLLLLFPLLATAQTTPVAVIREPNGAWVAVTPSPSGTAVAVGSTGTITDAAGNIWTIPSTGIVNVNGTPDLSTWQVKEIAYVNSTIWQFNGTNWYSKAVPLWGTPTTVSPIANGAVLTWVAPTTNTDGTPLKNLGGYQITYGQTPTSLTVVNVPSTTTSYSFSNLAPGTWYFEVAAVTTAGAVGTETAVLNKVIP